MNVENISQLSDHVGITGTRTDRSGRLVCEVPKNSGRIYSITYLLNDERRAEVLAALQPEPERLLVGLIQPHSYQLCHLEIKQSHVNYKNCYQLSYLRLCQHYTYTMVFF